MATHFSILAWRIPQTEEPGSLEASLVVQTVKNLPAMQETQVWSLGHKDPVEKGLIKKIRVALWHTLNSGVTWQIDDEKAANWSKDLESYTSALQYWQSRLFLKKVHSCQNSMYKIKLFRWSEELLPKVMRVCDLWPIPEVVKVIYNFFFFF